MSNPQHTHFVAMSTWTQIETERAFKRAARAAPRRAGQPREAPRP